MNRQKIAEWARARGLHTRPEFRTVFDLIASGAKPKLLTSSVKTRKGEKYGILTGIQYLAPASESGIQVCPWHSAGCASACLGHSSGRMRIPAHKVSRILRTWWAFGDRPSYRQVLLAELQAIVRRGKKHDMAVFVRLNGTSDLPIDFFLPEKERAQFKHTIRFYDYTKYAIRAEYPPADVHYTFSRSETTCDDTCRRLLSAGRNVAVVFAGPLPETYLGFRVEDGDDSDARPSDARGVVIGLSPKGPLAKRDMSGFVVRTGA